MIVSRSMPPSRPPLSAEEVMPLERISCAVLRASRLRTTFGADDEERVRAWVIGRTAGRGREARATEGSRRNMVGRCMGMSCKERQV